MELMSRLCLLLLACVLGSPLSHRGTVAPAEAALSAAFACAPNAYEWLLSHGACAAMLRSGRA